MGCVLSRECLDDERIIEDFETFVEPINGDLLRRNFEFLRNNVSCLLSYLSSMIDLADNTINLVLAVNALMQAGKYVDYVMFATLPDVVCPHVMGAYVNLMLGYPFYTLFSFRVMIEALAASAYIDMKYHGRDLREKLYSNEYMHFSLRRFKDDIVKYLGKELTRKVCDLHDELSSLWIHPIARLRKEGKEEPAGQLIVVALHHAVAGTPPSYLYPPPHSYGEQDIPLLKYVERVASKADEVMTDIYALWCNYFGIIPCVEVTK